MVVVVVVVIVELRRIVMQQGFMYSSQYIDMRERHVEE